MKKYFLPFYLLISIPSLVFSQETPNGLKSLFPSNREPGYEVRSKKSLSGEQREFLAQGAFSSKVNCNNVNVSADYLEQLSDINIQRDLKSSRSDREFVFLGDALLGSIEESNLRKTLVFGKLHDATATLTIWHFKKDGASMILLKENFNQYINKIPAICSLASNDSEKKVLWKFMWIKNDVSYELTIDDMVNEKRMPGYSVQQLTQEIGRLFSKVEE
ncbi:hypothetical protein [Rugamonas aquatica]|uniref:Uncharacterized protein n=1 Tax=Rugamonas aquatica TaxID=2743357 RepID=A0A6A7N6I1_9BURK|nr:hypothetical protein [Rugamonas aquatica]MQA40660.1 hypothetical protein [Rugamonas aquatica]